MSVEPGGGASRGTRTGSGSAAGSGRRRTGTQPTARDGPRNRRRRYLDDPVAVRALAHAVRHDVLRIIARLGQATTADAARELGISHGLASHHLRLLAKYGFTEQITGKDHRERPWRLAATSWNMTAGRAAPGTSEAAEVYEQFHAEQTVEDFIGWQHRRQAWPAAWRQHTGIGRCTIYLTEQELAEVTAAIDAVLLRHAGGRPAGDVAARPPGSVPVEFTLFAIPAGDPARAGDRGADGRG